MGEHSRALVHNWRRPWGPICFFTRLPLNHAWNVFYIIYPDIAFKVDWALKLLYIKVKTGVLSLPANSLCTVDFSCFLWSFSPSFLKTTTLLIQEGKRERETSAHIEFLLCYFLPVSVPAETRQSREGAWKCPPGSWYLVTVANCDHRTCWKQTRLSNLRPKDTGHSEHTWAYWTIWAHIWTLDNMSTHRDTGQYECT